MDQVDWKVLFSLQCISTNLKRYGIFARQTIYKLTFTVMAPCVVMV